MLSACSSYLPDKNGDTPLSLEGSADYGIWSLGSEMDQQQWTQFRSRKKREQQREVLVKISATGKQLNNAESIWWIARGPFPIC